MFVRDYLGHSKLSTTDRYVSAKHRPEDFERLNRVRRHSAAACRRREDSPARQPSYRDVVTDRLTAGAPLPGSPTQQSCCVGIPSFDDRGNLPPGIYLSTWDEVVTRYAINESRAGLLRGYGPHLIRSAQRDAGAPTWTGAS